MMPDLPNMGRDRDLDGFREYFENPNFRSDGLKIYPTLVIRGFPPHISDLIDHKVLAYMNYGKLEIIKTILLMNLLMLLLKFSQWFLLGLVSIGFRSGYEFSFSH